jgi:hypothetical protein
MPRLRGLRGFLPAGGDYPEGLYGPADLLGDRIAGHVVLKKPSAVSYQLSAKKDFCLLIAER